MKILVFTLFVFGTYLLEEQEMNFLLVGDFGDIVKM